MHKRIKLTKGVSVPHPDGTPITQGDLVDVSMPYYKRRIDAGDIEVVKATKEKPNASTK